VIQGTLTGSPVECITFNFTRQEASNQLTLNQLPQNQSSQLMRPIETIPSKMSIHWSEAYEANFDVLVTDYGETNHMFIERDRAGTDFCIPQTISPDFSSVETTRTGNFSARPRFCREQRF
jgi:hypothetical protein